MIRTIRELTKQVHRQLLPPDVALWYIRLLVEACPISPTEAYGILSVWDLKLFMGDPDTDGIEDLINSFSRMREYLVINDCEVLDKEECRRDFNADIFYSLPRQDDCLDPHNEITEGWTWPPFPKPWKTE